MPTTLTAHRGPKLHTAGSIRPEISLSSDTIRTHFTCAGCSFGYGRLVYFGSSRLPLFHAVSFVRIERSAHLREPVLYAEQMFGFYAKRS